MTALISTEKKHDLPILVVDKKGLIGEEIVGELKNESLVVYVSSKRPEFTDNVVHIPYIKRFPTIPDNIYSHIFVIDETTSFFKETISAFLEKAKNDNSLLLFISNIKEKDDKIIEKVTSFYQNAKFAVYGEIFTKNEIFQGSLINKFIYEIKTYGRIEIPGNGLQTIYPVFLEDLISGIFEAMFASMPEEKVFYILPKHGITLISLARLFQRIDPEIKIDFKNHEGKEEEYLPGEGKYLISDNYELGEKLKKINLKKNKEKTFTPQYIVDEPKAKRNFNFKYLFISLIVFVLLPFLSTGLFAFSGKMFLQQAQNELFKGNFKTAPVFILLSKDSFSLADNFMTILAPEMQGVGMGDRAILLTEKIDKANNLTRSFYDAYTSVSELSSNNNPHNLSKAYTSLKTFLSEYEKDKDLLPLSLSSKLDPLVSFSEDTLLTWPDILGFNGQRTYLILFQNNMELRPGGGFIGSYGLLSLSNGKINDFKVHDVYDADGQLKKHIEPPFAVRRYLPQVHWYLRDSNFDVDFSRGAIASAMLLDEETSQKVDGVIGVDINFVKNLLSIIGPVNVPDYNETVTDQNLFQLTESHAEKNFFPGSTQKKDFLSSLFNAIQQKISSGKFSYLNLSEALINSVGQKHLLFAFNESNIQDVFSVNGLSSSIDETRPVEDGNINDFIGINEANLGANKVNFFVDRSVLDSIKIGDDGIIKGSLNITYKNKSDGTWPGGDYKNYLRVILPKGSTLASIRINGKSQKIVNAVTDPSLYEAKNFKVPSGIEVEKLDEGDKTIFGFLVTVKMGETQSVQVDYSEGTVYKLTDNFTYNLRILKQPGTEVYPFSLGVNYPSSFAPVNDSAFKTTASGISYTTNLEGDKDLSVIFGSR